MVARIVEEARTVPLTPDLIRRFVEMDKVVHDRDISKKHLNDLQREMDQGLLRPPHWYSCYCHETGLIYRVDGQHTSYLFSLANGNLPVKSVILSHYEADTFAEVAELYSGFNKRSGVRTTAQQLKAYLLSHPQLRELYPSTTAIAVSGIVHATNRARRFDPLPDERGRILLNNVPFILLFDSLAGKNTDGHHLCRVVVASAMYSTFQKHSKGARAFWKMVKYGCHSVFTHPSRGLNKFLLETSLYSGGKKATKNSKRMTDPVGMYVVCVRTWNQWCQNENADIRILRNADTSKILAPSADTVREAEEVLKRNGLE